MTLFTVQSVPVNLSNQNSEIVTRKNNSKTYDILKYNQTTFHEFCHSGHGKRLEADTSREDVNNAKWQWALFRRALIQAINE